MWLLHRRIVRLRVAFAQHFPFCNVPFTVEVIVFAGVVIGIAGCSSPSKPSASLAGARPSSPSDGAQVSFYAQPVTLRAANAVTSGQDQITNTFQLATDNAFSTVVVSKDVTQAANGQTTLTLDPLSSKDYYWRVRSHADDSTGTVSPTFKFTIGPPLAIQPPVPVQPLAGSLVHKRPTFTVTNAVRTGPAPSAPLSYRFDVASDAGFGSVIATGVVPEGQGQTSFTLTTDLISGASFYWRARATDSTTGVVSNYSTSQSFRLLNPDDGVFRYLLTLHPLSLADCDSHGFLVPPPPLRDVMFDDGLFVNGNNLRYTIISNGTVTVALNLERMAGTLSGTLHGDGLGWPGEQHLGVFYKTEITGGTADVMGHLTGTARGWLSDDGFPAYTFCKDATLAFTLVPHP